MSPTQGILYVTMQPSATLPAAEFHDWYNNEHGPLRLRLPFIKNGFRYRATDLGLPQGQNKHEWMAIYDTPSMDEFNSKSYLALREGPVQSQRERDIRPNVDIDRRAYDFLSERVGKDFVPLEDIANQGKSRVLVSALFRLHEGQDKKELDRWYEEEHIDMLARVPGWLRTRRFVTAAIDKKDYVDFLALHEFEAGANALHSSEFGAAIATPWSQKILNEVVKDKTVRFYELFYTFGAAPRDVGNFVAAGAKKWENETTKTKTVVAGNGGGAVESYITTKDGVELPFRLEGSTDPDAPLIVLSNSILVEWGIWDAFVAAFLKKNPQYRILRYHTRGRYNNVGDTPVTVDVLGSDIIALLDTLKTRKAASVIGVSLGGATVLNVALNYPDRVGSFISCDTNDKSPAGNSKAWGERIEIAEKEGLTAQSGEKIVGEELAEITTRRWFVKESYDGGAREKECQRVNTMVVNNSLEGFKKSVRALWEYDMQPQMKDAKVRGIFLAGSGDGVLPKTMKDMASRYGGEAEFEVIEGAGHLPMVEKPEEVAAVATKLLSS